VIRRQALPSKKDIETTLQTWSGDALELIGRECRWRWAHLRQHRRQRANHPGRPESPLPQPGLTM